MFGHAVAERLEKFFVLIKVFFSSIIGLHDFIQELLQVIDAVIF